MVNSPAVTHQLLENGIHEFHFLHNGRRVADEYVVFLAEMTRSYEPGTMLRLIINMSENGIPPVTYLSRRIKETLDELPHRLPSRTAMIHDSHSMVTILADAAVRLMASAQIDKVRFFTQSHREEAIAWVLE